MTLVFIMIFVGVLLMFLFTFLILNGSDSEEGDSDFLIENISDEQLWIPIRS